MKISIKKFLNTLKFNRFAENATSSHASAKIWLQQALTYGFAADTTDYTKYISPDYVMRIDNKPFNFTQWQHHMNGLKKIMQSYQLTFNDMIVEGNRIAANFIVHATKKDGTQLDIKVLAFFKIKNNKMVACDELTHLLNGPAADKELAKQN